MAAAQTPQPPAAGGGIPGERLPPPRFEVGVLGWVRENLFGSWFNSILSVISTAVIVLVLVYGLRWVIAGADWEIIRVLGGQMVIGQYNTEGACPGQNCFWRPQVALMLVSVLLGDGMGNGRGRRREAVGNWHSGSDHPVRFPALQFRAHGHGREAAAGGQHPGAAAGVGRRSLHRSDGAGHNHIRGSGLHSVGAAAAGAGGGSWTATGAGESLGPALCSTCCSRWRPWR